MATGMSETKVQDAMAAVVLTEEDRKKAERQLTTWSQKNANIVPDEEGTIRLYLALQSLKTGGRVTPKDLAQWKHTAVGHTLHKTTYWVLPKTLRPDLDQELPANVFVDPASFDIAVDNPGAYWFLDQCVPQEKLGPGATTIEAASGIAKTADLGQPVSCGSVIPALGAQQHVHRPAAQSLPAQEVRAADPTPLPLPAPSQPTRVLSEHPSNPDEPEADVDITEKIAVCTMRAFASKRYYSSDLMDADTVHFWMREYARYLEQRIAETGSTAALDVHMKQYLRYVAKELMKEECFYDLPPLADVIKLVLATAPDCAHALARSVAELTSEEAMRLGELELPFLPAKHRSSFFQCALYKRFLKARFIKRLEEVSAAKGMPDGQRREITRTLASQARTDDQKKSLAFATAWLGPMEELDKLKFFMGSKENIALLQLWEPTSTALPLQLLMSTQTAFKEVTPEKFKEAADLVGQHPELCESVAHPTVKTLLRAFVGMLAADTPSVQARRVFIEDIFMELSAAKLGLLGGYSAATAEPYVQNDDAAALAQIHKAASSLLRKGGDGPVAAALVAWHEKEHAARQPQEAAEAKAPTTTLPTQVGAVGATGTVEVAPGGGAVPTAPASETGAAAESRPAASVERFSVGDEVVVSATKQKDKFNGQRAKVVRLLLTNVKVEMISGPAKGEVVDKQPQHLSFPASSAAGPNLSVVPPAGTKRSAEEGGDTNPSAKASKSASIGLSEEKKAAMATALFGDEDLTEDEGAAGGVATGGAAAADAS